MLALALLVGCSPDEATPIETTDLCGATEQVGVTATSHSKGHGDASVLFGDEDVPRIDVVLCASDFAAAVADVEDIVGDQQGGPGGGFSDETPMYIPSTIVVGDQVWPQVGFRFKGNSSLYSAVRSGIEKLPFRLDFDRYEEEHPTLEDQRFHGFADLKFSSAYKDSTFQRDKLTSDVFREAGVPAARGGFVEVYVDAGEGPVYWGLYAAFEDPAGEMLDDWFGDDSGNLYKPDGDAATLSTFVEADFEKKTNEEAADYSDVIAFIDALNADDTDAEAWRSGLEATFDMDGFIRYLALNNLIGNWDVYGQMTHNYYLYADPADGGRLTWIPWDFNEAWGEGNGNRRAVDIDLSNISGDWPLLEAVRDDPVYRARYDAEVEDLLATTFDADDLEARITANEVRITASAVAERSPYTNASEDIGRATTSLIRYVEGQIADATR